MYPEKNREMIEKMLDMIQNGQLKPLVKSYPLKEWKLAFEDMIERRSVGKVVIDFTDQHSGKL